MPGIEQSPSTRRPWLARLSRRRWNQGSVVTALSWMLLSSGALAAQPSGSSSAGPSSPAGLDVAAVGAAIGRDVARRWCAGVDPRQAIEEALIADLRGRNIAADGISQATTQALGREISVEAFAQAFNSCPQTARQVFRRLMQ